ncbi:transcription antitermination factor NusB [Rarobacter faecitabidus]|uniref:16S rRNA (Cytosine967-C5)-methyltransferase n=1 Tax=Rarobacter faecitabidus TaxID=13243 RepID=A0A542ZVI9_RARFA|nr:transcription antitermination factor NusB [Rarobacter faecitabidus]TQL64378.1 16S rRNA (cytosine967-C5)-methyltransferase [Rarobacter faecitabidus]
MSNDDRRDGDHSRDGDRRGGAGRGRDQSGGRQGRGSERLGKGSHGASDEGRDAAGRHRGAARLRGDASRTNLAPSERRRSTDPARLVAFDVLEQVETNDAYANLSLPVRLDRARLHGRDAGFATELTYGTLRQQGLYDAILARCVDRDLRTVDPALLVVLRLGAHQLLGMRVPPHAAVSQTVALARERIGAGPGQLVNAVLRKVSAKERDEWLAELLAEAEDDVVRLSLEYSHPAWIVRALRGALIVDGRTAAELPDLLAADNEAPAVTFVARPGLLTTDELLADVPRGKTTRFSPVGVTATGVSPSDVRSVRRGAAGVQDEGSQLVALALAAAPIDGPDERWLDMCAGPGGKTALLAAIAAERGARVLANEAQAHRTELVRRNLSAVDPVAIEAVVTGDGRLIGEDEPASFDRILVDAPCTGLGALRRRPESRWRKKVSDLPELTALQGDLLASALAAVRVGGVVAYVTCSPHHAETRLVVEDALRGRDDFELMDAPAALQRVVATGADLELGDGPHAQLWPHAHGTDAMHLTLLRRIG